MKDRMVGFLFSAEIPFNSIKRPNHLRKESLELLLNAYS